MSRFPNFGHILKWTTAQEPSVTTDCVHFLKKTRIGSWTLCGGSRGVDEPVPSCVSRVNLGGG